MHIVEVGGGFGGQAIAVAGMRGGGFATYADVDLAESCLLAAKHIQLTRALPAASAVERDALGHFTCTTSDNWQPQPRCDLFISNYALSELSAVLQKKIIRDIVSSCKRGHIEANDISRHHGLAGSSTEELVKALRDAGLPVVLQPLFMGQESLQVTVIEWGCNASYCSGYVE